jgi:hypothetical protein
MARYGAALVGHAALLGVFFWWLGIPDAKPSQVAMSAGTALAWVAAVLLLERFLFRGAKWSKALSSPRFWAAVALFAASLVVARLLIFWIPAMPGLGWQLFSVTLRFGLAWALINAAWLGIAWQAAPPPSQDRLAPVTAE